jgi:hypothetical protein
MKLNIIIEEFLEKWYLKNDDDETYTNGTLEGFIFYENSEYIVVQLNK